MFKAYVELNNTVDATGAAGRTVKWSACHNAGHV